MGVGVHSGLGSRRPTHLPWTEQHRAPEGGRHVGWIKQAPKCTEEELGRWGCSGLLLQTEGIEHAKPRGRRELSGEQAANLRTLGKAWC